MTDTGGGSARLVRSRAVVFRGIAVGLGLATGYLLALVLLEIAAVDPGWLLRRVRYQLIPLPATGIYRRHPRLGHVHIPSSVAHVETSEFDVLYTIDASGGRLVPGARPHLPAAVFLGDSFTFGHGVEDHEAYPAQVQRRWPGFQVRNQAINGGGTAHAMLALKRELMRDRNRGRHDERVALAVYGWLVIHNYRNYLDRSWLELLARGKQKLPLFGVENGRPRFLRMVDASEGRSRDEEGFVEAEWTVTEALIREMAALSRERGVRFVVVVLPVILHRAVQHEALARLVPFLAAERIETLDLQDLAAFATDDGLIFPVDQHPTAEWHRRVGAAIADALQPPG